MITQVHVQNVRVLRYLRLTLEPLTVLVGPSGTGKSTVLKELRALCDILSPADGRPNERFQERMGRLSAAHVAGPGQEARWTAWTTDEWQVLLKGAREGATSSWQGLALNLTKGMTSHCWTDVPHSVRAWPPPPTAFTPRSALLTLQPHAIAQPAPLLAPVLPDGSGISGLLADLAINTRQAFEAIERDLRAVVPQVRSLKVRPRPLDGGPGVAGHQIAVEMVGGGVIEAPRLSEGTQFALALLTIVHDPEGPGLVLIDDIDRGLHPAAQGRLIRAIREVQKGRPDLQIVCSSHSPYLLDLLEPKEVRILSLSPDGWAQCTPLAEHPEFERWRSMLRPGEIWMNLSETWETASHV